MKKGILIALIVGLAVAFYAYGRASVSEVSVNEISTESPSEKREAAFQDSQATYGGSSLPAIEADLNNTVILDEDFSDLEK